MIKTVFLGILLTVIGATSHADGENSNNNCSKLNVIITNNTDAACKLKHQQLNHGFFIYTSSVPAFIPAQQTSQSITLTQSIFGSDLDVTYQCGDNKELTLKSSQGFCFIFPVDVHGYVFSAKNLNANFSVQSGSYIWSQHGTIHWEIVN